MASRRIATVIGASVAVICGVGLVVNKRIYGESDDSIFEPAHLIRDRLHESYTSDTIPEDASMLTESGDGSHNHADTNLLSQLLEHESLYDHGEGVGLDDVITVQLENTTETHTADTTIQTSVPSAKILGALSKTPDAWFLMIIGFFLGLGCIVLESGLMVMLLTYLSAALTTAKSLVRTLLSLPGRLVNSWAAPSELERLRAERGRAFEEAEALRRKVGKHESREQLHQAQIIEAKEHANEERREIQAAADSEIARLQQLSDGHSRQLDLAVFLRNKLQEEHDHNLDRIDILQKAAKDAEDAVLETTEQVKEKEDLLALKEDELTRSAAALEEARQENARLQDEISKATETAQDSITRLESKERALTAQLKKTTEENEGLRRENQNLQESARASQSEISSWKERYNESIKTAEGQSLTASRLADLSAKRSDGLSTRATKLEGELSEARASIQMLSSSKDTAWANVKWLGSRIEELHMTRTDARNEANSSKEQVMSLGAELRQLKQSHRVALNAQDAELDKSHDAIDTVDAACQTDSSAPSPINATHSEPETSPEPLQRDSCTSDNHTDGTDDAEDPTETNDDGQSDSEWENVNSDESEDDDSEGDDEEDDEEDIEARRAAFQSTLQAAFGASQQTRPTDEQEASDEDDISTDPALVRDAADGVDTVETLSHSQHTLLMPSHHPTTPQLTLSEPDMTVEEEVREANLEVEQPSTLAAHTSPVPSHQATTPQPTLNGLQATVEDDVSDISLPSEEFEQSSIVEDMSADQAPSIASNQAATSQPAQNGNETTVDNTPMAPSAVHEASSSSDSEDADGESLDAMYARLAEAARLKPSKYASTEPDLRTQWLSKLRPLQAARRVRTYKNMGQGLFEARDEAEERAFRKMEAEEEAARKAYEPQMLKERAAEKREAAQAAKKREAMRAEQLETELASANTPAQSEPGIKEPPQKDGKQNGNGKGWKKGKKNARQSASGQYNNIGAASTVPPASAPPSQAPMLGNYFVSGANRGGHGNGDGRGNGANSGHGGNDGSRGGRGQRRRRRNTSQPAPPPAPSGTQNHDSQTQADAQVGSSRGGSRGGRGRGDSNQGGIGVRVSLGRRNGGGSGPGILGGSKWSR